MNTGIERQKEAQEKQSPLILIGCLIKDTYSIFNISTHSPLQWALDLFPGGKAAGT